MIMGTISVSHLKLSAKQWIRHFLKEFKAACKNDNMCNCGSRDGAVVRTLASHQSGSGLIPGVDAICGLGLLLVLVPFRRVFLQVQ